MRRLARTLCATAMVVGGLAGGELVGGGQAAAYAPAGGTPTARSAGEDPAAGHITGGERIIRGQCKLYRYSYRVHPTTTDWALNTSLVNPKGRKVSTGYFASGADQTREQGTFKLCRPETKPGRYVIRGTLTMDDGFDQTTEVVVHGVLHLRLPHKDHGRHD